jgi:hypothetical protein
MLVRRNGRGPQRNRRLISWPRWVQAWRDDHEQRAAARAEARAHAPVRPGERLLTVAGGELAVATDWALYHQAGLSWARLGWEQVGRADWDEQRRVLMLTGLTPTVPARTVLRLARNWDLPAVAAERVSWAKVVDQRISLNGEAGARVIARRVPGGPQVRWLVVLDQGLDAADPEVRAGLEAAVAELRAATGAGYGAGADPLGVRQRARG